jgi:ribonuclease HI
MPRPSREQVLRVMEEHESLTHTLSRLPGLTRAELFSILRGERRNVRSWVQDALPGLGEAPPLPPAPSTRGAKLTAKRKAIHPALDEATGELVVPSLVDDDDDDTVDSRAPPGRDTRVETPSKRPSRSRTPRAAVSEPPVRRAAASASPSRRAAAALDAPRSRARVAASVEPAPRSRTRSIERQPLHELDMSRGREFPSLIIATDGASRGNPGPASIGVVLATPDGKLVDTISKAIGRTTNNHAEYEAIRQGLVRARELGASQVCVRADSELVIRQLNGVYKVKNDALRPLFDEIRRAVIQFSEGVRFEHIRREHNRQADALANEALDRVT